LKKIIIIGGGLAGLVAAVKLINAGIPCLVIEKKNYPFHRVCGEYISNEAAPFLKSLGLYPEIFSPPKINRFTLSSIDGKSQTIPLDLGGFGISRFTFDNFIYQEALRRGVQFQLNTEVASVTFHDDRFLIKTSNAEMEADVVIGAFGKRSKLDMAIDRAFIHKRSPYVGVKYHVKVDFPSDVIALHNFKGGYCGVGSVEDGKVNLCYLTHRDGIRQHKNIVHFQEEVMFQNPHLKRIFTESEFLLTVPETINEISFETKSPVENHILMAGDAAGMITPLCGNGMAMAIHAAKILGEYLIRYCGEQSYTRNHLEHDYSDAWRKNFSLRLKTGRQVQRLFGQGRVSSLAVNMIRYSKPLAQYIIRHTHGPVF
jgi:flavin-dependent dehydrogenase